MFGQYKRMQNEFTGVMTGKGIAFGGSLIRTEATGYGVVFFMEKMLNRIGESVKGKTAAISGSGNVAQFTAEKLIALGAKVVTLSDSSGTIHDPDGIDEEKLAYVKELKNVRRGRIREYAEAYGVTFIEGQRPWSVPCDMAFPCATQNEISEKDARTLVANGCLAVSEGANMPTEQAGVDLFLAAKILYAPSKAANAGGVAVSGLEMSQNSMRIFWSREDVERRLRDIIGNIHDQCVRYGTKDDYVNYRKGANIAGFLKVADAVVALGVM